MTEQQQAGQRADKWLWHARFFKSRTLAQKLCAGRKLRINRIVVNKASAAVRPGDVLTFPQAREIRVIRIIALGTRRGPASEAQTLYEDLAPPAANKARDTAASTASGGGRPTKKQRRALYRLKSGEAP